VSVLATGSAFQAIVDWSSIVSASVAVLVVALAAWVSGATYQTLALVARRRRSIGRAMRRAGFRTPRFRFSSASWLLLSQRVRGLSPQVCSELTWLSELVGATILEEELPKPSRVPVPFTFAARNAAADYCSTLSGLADAYESYAAAVRRRWTLRSAAGQLVAQEYQCARDTADLLRRWATFEPVAFEQDPDKLRGRTVDLAPSGGWPRSVRLVTWPEMTGARASTVFPVLGVSYQPYRVTMTGSPARSSTPDAKLTREVTDVRGLAGSDPLTFDGVLPRWHGAGFRVEIDRVTGRQKLHLCVAETTYFAFLATQAPASAELAGDDALCSRLLTLNLLAMDEDDVVLLTRRSDYVVHAGGFTGTVSGNCELVSREGLSADLDGNGLPDLLEAIRRETSEELGIDLSSETSQIGALGVFEVNGDTEVGTHVLLVTARIPGSARDFRISRSAPDPVEGLWEIGNQFMTIDIAAILKDRDAAERFIIWLRTSPEVTPSAAGSLLLLLTTRIELYQNQATRAARNGRQHAPPSWTTADLATWLSAPLTAAALPPPDTISYHPLWT
jgi:8-oxo-dGTP pyrophosphatase MutT (NUDIX family)